MKPPKEKAANRLQTIAAVKETTTTARRLPHNSATVKRQTKRERVMLAFDEAVASLVPGPRFSALKGNLMYVLHEKWSMARKIDFFERFAADGRRIAR
jgi:hypothetical protein